MHFTLVFTQNWPAFCTDSKEDAASTSGEAEAFVTGVKQAPLPTYFIGSFGAGSKEAMRSLSTADTNIHYLGTSGVKTLQGLNVAFLDGIYNAADYSSDAQETATGCRHYTQVSTSVHKSRLVCQVLQGTTTNSASSQVRILQADVKRLKMQLEDTAGDVDLLLTCEWPEGILLAMPPGSAPEGVNPSGTPSALQSPRSYWNIPSSTCMAASTAHTRAIAWHAF